MTILAADIQAQIDRFNAGIQERNPAKYEFHQAVREFTEMVMTYVLAHPKYRDAHILERMTEPDRIAILRVCWEDDKGAICCNRAWRVQFNNAIGLYKGGRRFHPSVTPEYGEILGI